MSHLWFRSSGDDTLEAYLFSGLAALVLEELLELWRRVSRGGHLLHLDLLLLHLDLLLNRGHLFLDHGHLLLLLRHLLLKLLLDGLDRLLHGGTHGQRGVALGLARGVHGFHHVVTRVLGEDFWDDQRLQLPLLENVEIRVCSDLHAVFEPHDLAGWVANDSDVQADALTFRGHGVLEELHELGWNRVARNADR